MRCLVIGPVCVTVVSGVGVGVSVRCGACVGGVSGCCVVGCAVCAEMCAVSGRGGCGVWVGGGWVGGGWVGVESGHLILYVGSN